MVQLNDPELVRRQYASEAGLKVRRESQRRFLRGPDAFDVAFDVIAALSPRRVLEVGCGLGTFAERLARETRAEVVATDLSPRMVELARERGLDARVADVEHLPFADGEFDCAVANAMLYHVEQLDRALSELARVLEPAGRLVAVTIGTEHLGEVWSLVGYRRPDRPFSRENGAEQLGRHFREVERRDVDAELVFPDAAAVHRYVESTIFADEIARPLPGFDGPFPASVRATVFVAER
ncbi:MAG TPA: class I SAM-dependent methyltransferase [Gaiellaceae bacterium]|nr:class I SAM-dependent methyltransferase [Gaiellaceae bacterium]